MQGRRGGMRWDERMRQGKEERKGSPRKRNSGEDRRRIGDVEEETKEEKGVGNESKRLFGFSRILRFYVHFPSSSDSCCITE